MRRKTWLYLGASLSGVFWRAAAVGCLRTEVFVLVTEPQRWGPQAAL